MYVSDITLIVLCAGNSSRFEHKAKKQWLRIDNNPLWLHVVTRLESFHQFAKVIITSHPNEINYMRNIDDSYEYVTGGSTRQESISNSLKSVDTKYVMVTDVARACIPLSVINKLINEKESASCIVPTLNVSDTVIYEGETINRDNVKLIQTPQLSLTSSLKKAIDTDIEYTDESSAIKAINEPIKYVQGSINSKKLTFGDELNDINCLSKPSNNSFVGFGYDVHQFEDKKKMYLGGIEISDQYGFKAHSDGDVLIHSVIDALLGAIGAGDIGEFFPDNDPKYKNADSKKLLEHIVEFVNNVGYEIINIDLSIIAEQPKINPHKLNIKKSLSKLLNIKPQFINIKATTSEKMGFIGRKEGVAVYSTATVKYYDWTK